ncbi:Putative protein of unknown function [Podospora comata]|uniref:Uncharacterized protein n=1 Tax=Podospora comata TaxID=48703 RepID=A0ABY6SAJ2_PODCO|nr:Putative protein of unknown function [Podospora comata]
MSTQQSREEQITGHGNLDGTLYPSPTKPPGWKRRDLLQRILLKGEDALIGVDISARTSLDNLLCFQPCVAVFTRRLPVLGVIKASVVKDQGLTPLEFKSHNPVVETIWGELTATHYVEVVLKQELYGFKGTSWENLLVVPDDFPRLPGDVFLGQPFLRKHCCNALPAKVPRHAGPQASSRHVTQDNSGGSGRKGTAKKPKQPKKRERSPQQAIPGGQQHVKDGQSSKKRLRTTNAAAFQQPAQMPNTDWVNQNQYIIDLPPQSPYGNRTRMPAAPTGPAVPWRNESMYPLLHLTLAYHPGEKLWLRQLYSWVVEMSSKAEPHVPLCGSGRLSIDGKARLAVLDQNSLADQAVGTPDHHPLVAAQYARNTPLPTVHGDGSFTIPTPAPPMPPAAPYYHPPQQAPGRPEPTYTPPQPQSAHRGMYIPHTGDDGDLQANDPGHFRYQYVQQVNPQGMFPDAVPQFGTPEEPAAPALEGALEEYENSSNLGYFFNGWDSSGFDPTGGSQA